MSLLTALFLSLATQAASVDYSGTLIKQSSRNFLRYDSQKNPVEIRGSTTLVNQILASMGNYDLASGRAEKITENIWLINNINFVGIRKILGPWKSVGPHKKIYNFKNHFDLRITGPTLKRSHTKINLNGNHSYSIAPVDGKLWKIFVSDSDTVLIANLTFSKNSMSLVFLDTTTGEEVESITLNRLK